MKPYPESPKSKPILYADENEFISRIKKLKKPISNKTGKATYTGFILKDNILSFERVNTGTFWELSLDDLYNVYKAYDFINTAIVKNATGGRVNSPSVAILMAIGCLDAKGYRIN